MAIAAIIAIVAYKRYISSGGNAACGCGDAVAEGACPTTMAVSAFDGQYDSVPANEAKTE